MFVMRSRQWMFCVTVILLSLLVGCSGGNAEPTTQVAVDTGQATEPAVLEEADPGQATEPAPEEEAGPAVSGTITLYTSVPQPIADRIETDFEQKFPDMNLEVFRAGTSEVVTKIVTEREAGAIQADLVWVAEPSTYEDFKAQDLLLQFTPEAADVLAEEMKDPEGYYYAARVINMVIGYNTAVDPIPSSWSDLTSGVYDAGKIGFPTPLRSGAAEAAVRALVDAFGWEYFEQFHANGGVQVQSNSTLQDQLSTNELDVGATLDYIVREAMATGSPVGYVWPEEGTVVIPSPVAIFSDSGNPQAAIAFVDYLLSQDGQQVMVELGNFYPVRDDVAPPEGTPPLDEITVLPVDWVAVREQREQTADFWESLFVE